MRTILILAANPKGTDRLRLDEEVKRIKQALRRAKKRDQFSVVDEWAVTDDDLRRALLDHEPEVVHFAGHGAGDGHDGTGRDLIPARGIDAGGLAFEDDTGNVQLISGDALARLFELCSDSVKCVVLNACYSEVQAIAITQHIDIVVGMNKAIGDPAAIKFAVGFYDALGAGKDFEKAYHFGRNAVDLNGIPEHLTPILKKNFRVVAVNAPFPTEGAPAAGTTGIQIGKTGMSVTPTTGPPSALSTNASGPIRLFYSYSHKDEALRDKLEEALALLKQQGLIAGWHDRRIGAGDEWSGAIDEHLQEAEMILLLVSASFIASKYCWDIEVKRALERHDLGEAKVVPVVLRPCDWQAAAFGKLQGLPKDGKAVTTWTNKDKAWTDVAKGIRGVAEAITSRPLNRPSGIDRKAGDGEAKMSPGGRGEDVRHGNRERIERRLKQLKPEVQSDLAKELLEPGDSILEEGIPPIADLLTILLEPSFSTIAGLAEIDDRLCGKGDWKSAEIVAEIIAEVTPLVIDDELVRQLWSEIHHRGSAFFRLPDYHSTTIEVLMASADGKGMNFKPPENEGAVDDYAGTPLLRRNAKLPVGAPETVESVARNILLDVCEGQSLRDSSSQSITLDELVQRLAGVLIYNSRGVNRMRTLYCLHTMPAKLEDQAVHENALKLVKTKLDQLKSGGLKKWDNFPAFVFLLLAQRSEMEDLRAIIIKMLTKRLEHARKRTTHGASG